MKLHLRQLLKYKKDTAGVLLFLAAILIFMGIITAESFYPVDLSYTTREDEISDLAATKPPDSIITQPSATIFNTTAILTGLMILVASVLLHLSFHKRLQSIPLSFLGLGILGVGLFPGNITPWHSIFAFLIFISGGIAALLSFTYVRVTLNYVFALLGVFSLFFLFTYNAFIPILGKGGTERYVVYPIIFWLMGVGTYIFGSKKEENTNGK